MADQDLVDIEIDGEKLQVEPGSMIIEAADKVGIKIPRFCYHKKLSVAANCRMCLVEVEKSRKPMPACATPVTPGMVVHTQSKEALVAQRAVMEFLLINHPLDCPICDQGGECELQDVAMGYGNSVSRFTEGKRAVEDKDIGSLIETEMTRCIHCTRCVRFGEEVAGLRELGATGRGEHVEIGTYIEKSLVSELSGNVIDLCPVGALTAKPSRYQARAWEMEQAATIAPHDCVGSNIFVHRLRDKALRVVPRDNESVNECWISDRDRFSYEGLYHQDRITSPQIKQDGQWKTVDWKTALTFAVEGLQKVIDNHTASQLGAIASPNATTEELFLLQKLMRSLGSQNVDHRLHQIDFSDQKTAPSYYGLPIAIEAIEKQQQILLVGSDLQREQPILGHRVRKAFLNGASVSVINPMAFDFNFDLNQQIVISPRQLVRQLASVVKAAMVQTNISSFAGLQSLLSAVDVTAQHEAIAKELLSSGDKLILLGALALNHSQASQLKALAEVLAEVTGATCGYLTEGANATGAWLAGALPHRTHASMAANKPGLDCQQQWQNQLKAYLLMNVEPELDCANGGQAHDALNNAEFVVSLSPFKSETMEQYANVILPICPFTETSGTFVNIEGRWQSFTAATSPLGEARPAWKVLRVLGNLFHADGFDYTSSQEVLNELKPLADNISPSKSQTESLPSKLDLNADESLARISVWPVYGIDNLVRRAAALQASGTATKAEIQLSSETAKQLQLHDAEQVQVKQNGTEVTLPLSINDNVPQHCVHIPAGFETTMRLGVAESDVTLERR